MKKELPIAVMLLAFGAWCCFHIPLDIPLDRPLDRPSDSSATASDVSPLQQARGSASNSFSVSQTSWQSPAANDDSDSADPVVLALDPAPAPSIVGEFIVGEFTPEPVAVDPTAGLRTFPPEAFLKIASAKDAVANEAFGQITQDLANAPAFATNTKIISQLFDVAMVARGKYFQTAGGEKSRMEIQTQTPVAKTVLQMSDGRFVYMLKSDQQQQRLEFIDLYRLGNRRGRASQALLPTTWVMGGGIGKAIAHYRDSFNFQQVKSNTPLATGDGITFRGIWKPKTLLRLLYAGQNKESLPPSVVWANVPRQMPHAIELTFAAAAGEMLVPKQISFFQFETESKVTVAKEMVRIEFLPFEFRNSLPDDLFTLESTDFEAVDITSEYNARISQLSQGLDKVARQRQLESGLR